MTVGTRNSLMLPSRRGIVLWSVVKTTIPWRQHLLDMALRCCKSLVSPHALNIRNIPFLEVSRLRQASKRFLLTSKPVGIEEEVVIDYAFRLLNQITNL